MYLLYRLRFVFFLVLVLGVAGGIAYVISVRTFEQDVQRFNLQVTAAVATAIEQTVLDVTRTAEAPRNRFQLVELDDPADLEAVAETYGTTLEILQTVNGLPPDVVEGHGETIVMPVGIVNLDPPRQIMPYTAQPGDTLLELADLNFIALDLIQADNPVLVERGVRAGDIVFIALIV